MGCLMFTLMTLEVALRVASSYIPRVRYFTTDPKDMGYLEDVNDWKTMLPHLLYPLIPGDVFNGFVINANGYLTPDVPKTKPIGTKRIVFLGDSQTVGEVSYPKHFTRLLERWLNVTTDHKTEVINLGVPGIGPKIESKILEYDGLSYQPDLVVLALFVGNDFSDDLVYSQDFASEQAKLRPLVPSWLGKFKTAKFVANFWKMRTQGKQLATSTHAKGSVLGTYIGPEQKDPTGPSFSEERFMEIEGDRVNILLPHSYIYDNWDNVSQSLLTIQTLCQSHNIPLLVLIIPDEVQVNESLRRAAAVKAEIPFDKLDTVYPQKFLEEFFTQNAISYVDVLDTWKQSAQADSYFILRDTHLNNEGNESVARLLYPVVLGYMQ
jgi:hypothetical protein